MESSSIASRALLLLLLLVLRSCARADNEDTEVDLDTRAIRDFYPKDPNLTSEKQLVSCINLKHMLKSFFFFIHLVDGSNFTELLIAMLSFDFMFLKHAFFLPAWGSP